VWVKRFIAVALALAACTGGGAPTTMPSAELEVWDISQPFVGFSLSPGGYDEVGFNEFFEKASDLGSLVAWVGAWEDLEQGGTLVHELSEQHGYVPVVVTGFPTDDGRRVLPEDTGVILETLSDWLTEHPVPYLGFGVEINSFLWEEAPEDFERFVELFPEIVATVHRVSPETVVFPGFQLERLRGYKSGLFGGVDTQPEWNLIGRFPDADAIGFTTYPGLIFAKPSEIPDDYYTEILEHTNKPVVFTEVGWQAGGDFGEWSGTPEKQANFVRGRIGEIAESANMVIWSFLWDQDAGPAPFATMGLVDGSGEDRPALADWQDLFG
jgi:hypothetical protein